MKPFCDDEKSDNKKNFREMKMRYKIYTVFSIYFLFSLSLCKNNKSCSLETLSSSTRTARALTW